MRHYQLAMAAMIVAATVSFAHAQSDADSLTYPGTVINGTSRIVVRVPSCVDGLPRLPELADRLGVRADDFQPGTMLLSMCDGRRYSIDQLIGAFLDRMDKTAK